MGRLSPYIHYLFSFYLYLQLWPRLIYPHPDTSFVFFGYIFLYLYLVSVYFTHWNITFCLVYQNVFCFTSLAPRSIFVYISLFLSPTWFIFVYLTFRVSTFWLPYYLMDILFMHLTSKHVVPSHFHVTPGGFACWSIGR